MSWARRNLFCNRYRNHHKLVVYRHYVVFFINATKHIEDIAPDIRKSMVVDNFEADVLFIVDDLKFPAHKRILKISNEQFYIEQIEPYQNSKEIEIKNIDPRGFQQFLRFCHFGDVNLNRLNVMQTYDVATTYNHSRLIALCTNFICDNIEISNVLEIANWNLMHQNFQIRRLCRGIFIDNAMKVLEDSKEFRKIDKKLLEEVLNLEVVNCSEMTLLARTLEWAEERCIEKQIEATTENKRNILEDILSLIRLEISPSLEVLNDFPTSPRSNRFNKRRFDNLFVQNEIEETWEEILTDENTTCFGFSIVLSNPGSRAEAHEEFLMTIESEHDLVLQKHFHIKTVEHLSIKEFVFEIPILLKRQKRHILKVKFFEPRRMRYMEKVEGNYSRILRLYD